MSKKKQQVIKEYKKNKKKFSAPIVALGVSSLFALGAQSIAVNAQTTNNSATVTQAMTKEQKGLTANIKDSVTVPASDLANAKSPGPFTAGVNQVIPFEAFGGDGMLTRLLLNSSDGAPWSDNGTGKNAALAPVDGLQKGQYFYEVDLDGNAAGKSDADLLKVLQSGRSNAYEATVKVYAAKDGKADTTQVVGQKKVKVNFAASEQKELTANIKDSVTVPASDLANAKSPGPFTAGVNQVIPFEAFGGDGMLTRLLLNSSDGAPWSDNGTGKNAALAPVEGLQKGQYFYEVDLDGNAAGKSDADLLKVLQSGRSNAYEATVKVYAAKDGKADTTQVVGQKTVKVNFAHSETKPSTTKPSTTKPTHTTTDSKEKAVILYRAYNPNSGEHLYTTNKAEIDNIVKAGWRSEGQAWKTVATGTPVYRLYNPNSGEHFYTMDTNEYAKVAAAGWHKEGIAFYSNSKKGTPIYRAFNPNAKGAGSHFFTASSVEWNHISSLGWHKEGIAFYGAQ